MRNDSVIPPWLYHGDEEAHEHKQLLFLYFFHFVSANLAHVALKEKHKGMKFTVRQCLKLTVNTLSRRSCPLEEIDIHIRMYIPESEQN